MPGMDTTMGGDLSRFPSTSLGMVLGAQNDREQRYREHLERLFTAYWKPVYYFIRRIYSRNDADAKDLTQDFLVSLVEYDAVSRFDPQKGNFRAYLKQCLKNFLNAQTRDAGRIKRGGGRGFVSIEQSLEDGTDLVPQAQGGPEEEFDRDWTREVLNASLVELEQRLRRQGKANYFDVFRIYALEQDANPPTYQGIASQLRISESDVRNHLHAARRELRQIVMSKISEYVVDEEGLLLEMSRVLGEGR